MVRATNITRDLAKETAGDMATDLNTGSLGTPTITAMQVIPVAGHDSMLFNLCGAHAPYFIRTLVLLQDSAGRTGIGEVPGGAGITGAL